MNKFFHQERKNIHSTRNPASFRTSINRSKIINKNKFTENQITLRDSLESRDAYDPKRYGSLDASVDKGKKYSQMDNKAIDQMNRTFMANTKNKVGRLIGLNVDLE